jgi:hypothetical protein
MSVQKYYEVPILKYIEPTTFVDEVLSMNSENQKFVLGALGEQYKFENINLKFIEELEWLKSIQNLLQKEVENRRGKVSGFVLDSFINHYLNGAIERLEKKNSQTKISQ